ncbi:Hypothetical protein LUCI_0297 [Lucifera butyrica]|uniref:Uncharacterized protein n=1 Tax=Lucifera butyrica TaxID=1351585 RepID=A0A498R185_9FIRM|nr:hypothetical protein [Lucifera butyrica]VBB05091.1 Hypothetical protein LUCI_0297 [Lucifera butyrica]
MANLTLIFVGGDSEVDKIIQGATHGPYSHVAGIILNSTLESLGMKDRSDPYPGVWLHDPDKYRDSPDAEFIEVEIPDLMAAESEARKLIGSPYGYVDCVRGGLYDLTGVKLPGNLLAMNCSETWTRILHAGGLKVLNDVAPDCVTPMDLRRAV